MPFAGALPPTTLSEQSILPIPGSLREYCLKGPPASPPDFLSLEHREIFPPLPAMQTSPKAVRGQAFPPVLVLKSLDGRPNCPVRGRRRWLQAGKFGG